ncbi:putative bifunctional diguanylate cyclase/phosphodiesterase [Billgrantia bachuensis]|uniref:EAL domain-containing protein n=1 Tax=Billgrantia bachuensis TaxID=2717286 RepID=A0ABX0PMI0_9GAMM|nr:EAL domain-containing protein [Halomonas bachuensis]NIC03826.1 EAL domain-containing protein [Halomonas bachuensis]
MPEILTPPPRPGSSIEVYIRSIGRYYIGIAIIMTLLIGAIYLTVKIALDRHAVQQEISFLTSQKFIRFQQLTQQTRAVMSASADPTLPEHVIQPMLDDVRTAIEDIRAVILRLKSMHRRLDKNLLERISRQSPAAEALYVDLDRRLEDFLSRAERIVDASHADRQRRYTYWGPIDFAISADSLLMRQFNDIIQHANGRSEVSIGNAVSISTALLLMLAILFLLASILLFYPLLMKLRSEHLRKMEFEKKLTHLAQTDPLTRLKNRSYFNSALNALLYRYRKDGMGFSMLMVDLDNFKAINDGFGHPAGDATLLHVARAFQNVFQPHDIIARIGGDEFAILLPDIDDEASLNAIAEHAIKSLAADFSYEDNTLRTSASVGGAIVPVHATDEAGLVRVADLALYAAKAESSSAFIFDEETLATRLEQNELAAALAGATDRDEFVVHYQPKVDLATGNHLGFEALVRWNHPTLGLLAPGVFLPLMKGPRLIGDMTLAVARTVCRDLKAWKKARFTPGPVAINLPEALLINESGFEMLASTLRECELHWHDLTIEVTEDVFLNRHAEHMRTSMMRFREHGVSIALDDFGTGFASLLHLRDFPFDELKIDRGFVADIGQDSRSEQIINAIIDLSRNLGKRCIAEGIETETQRQFLLEAGCTIGQGYWFARPMPCREVREWLKQPMTEAR